MVSESVYDAIVVGTRCSGASTAALLAKKGHRVLAVDRSAFPSDVLSTHFLWPHGMSYLNRWGLMDKVLAATPSHTIVNLVNEGIPLAGEVPLDLLRQHFKEMHQDDSGVVQRYASVRRKVLDEILVEAAAEAGAEVRQGFAVEDLLYDGDQVVGVAGRTRGGERVEERARVVIGADGRNSMVARTLRLPKHDQRPKCTFAYWSYFSGFDLTTARLHRRGRLGMAVVPTSFGQNMTLVWGPSEWSKEFRGDIQGNFHKALDFISPEIGELVRTSGRREERFFGTLDQAAFLRPLSGPGWVLVGDAECFKDQCTATGMTYAFRDAELASAAIHSWLAGEKPLDEALNDYRGRRRSQVAAAYYDYTCTLAEMQTLRHDELQLFVALQSNQDETDRLIATHADIAPVSEFFQASNLFLLNDTAKQSSDAFPIFSDFENTTKSYRQNLFA